MNNDAQQALDYLSRDPVFCMDMLEPIRRGQADVVEACPEGVLLYERRSKAYMLAADSNAVGQELCKGLSEVFLFVAHDRENAVAIRDRFGFGLAQKCWAAAYLRKERLLIAPDLEIRRLDEGYFRVIYDHYSTFSDEQYVRERIRDGVMHGVFRNGVLLGFAGLHAEGSVGLLEVLPEYRRQGAAAALMAAMVNWCLERDYIPFSQIFEGNEASLALHKKLGFTISEKSLYWVIEKE